MRAGEDEESASDAGAKDLKVSEKEEVQSGGAEEWLREQALNSRKGGVVVAKDSDSM